MKVYYTLTQTVTNQNTIRSYLQHRIESRLPFMVVSNPFFRRLIYYVDDMVCINHQLKSFIRLWKKKRQKNYYLQKLAVKNYFRFFPHLDLYHKKLFYANHLTLEQLHGYSFQST